MSRLFAAFAAILILFVVYGFYLSQFQFDLISNKKENSKVFFHDYKLVQNVHTQLSSGSGNILSISEEAKQARINYVMITDLNPFYALDLNRYINDIGFLFAAKRTSEQDKKIVFTLGRQELTILAHPLSRPFLPSDVRNQNFDGIEAINLKSITQQAWKSSRLNTLWSLLYYPFNPRLALMRLYKEPIEELSFFDQISQNRNTVLFQGAEATARAVPFADWLIKFPSYEMSFGISSQHLLLTSELTGQMDHDQDLILNALKAGQFYIAFDALGDPKGFETYLFTANKNKNYFLGAEAHYSKDLRLYYRLPVEPNAFYEVVLYRNGERIDHLNTFEGLFAIKNPGVYRLQVRLSPRLPLPDAIKWLTWIYTNNFYVR